MDEVREEMDRDPELRRLLNDEYATMQREQREWCARMSRARAIQAGVERDGD
ncbi:MAG: hypothetical protein HYV99_01545 [Betaproteobacteria bacterium]|nr:hypothetical protein [Betaproteobacteria bacterium]